MNNDSPDSSEEDLSYDDLTDHKERKKLMMQNCENKSWKTKLKASRENISNWWWFETGSQVKEFTEQLQKMWVF